MGSQALLEPVASLAGLRNAGGSLASVSNFASASVMRLLVRQPDRRPRSLPLSGRVVRALLPVENLQRSAFGGRNLSPCSTRLDVRGQASKKTFSSFDDMLQNCGVPVLVDFYAVWCGPCQMMVPILSEVSKALKDRIRVVKIDTEKYPDLASRFNVHALPTLVLFKNGQVADRVEGALRAEDLVSRIQKTL